MATTAVTVAIIFLLAYVVHLILRGLRHAKSMNDPVFDTPPPSARDLVPPLTELDFDGINCTHERREGEHVVTLRGYSFGVLLGNEMPLCGECTQSWLERHSTYCASCEAPICPGMRIATAPAGNEQPFVHFEPGCLQAHPALRLGVWGQGTAHWFEKRDG